MSVFNFHSLVILLAALIGVFLESACTLPRDLLGAPVHPLPPLIIYAALQSNLATLTLLAILGGLWQSALSADPVGISMAPLFLVGILVASYRKHFVRQQWFVHAMLGAAASALVPALVLFMLITLGHEPALNWFSLWQWLVASAGGGLITLAIFPLLDRARRALTHPMVQGGYRFSHEPASADES